MSGQLTRGRPECPDCGVKLDGYSEVVKVGTEEPENSPKGGDLTVCIECAALLQFGPGALVLERIHSLPNDTSPESAIALGMVTGEILKQIERRKKR